MFNILAHGATCFVWCFIWHQFHHWWAHKHEAHYKPTCQTVLTEDELVGILDRTKCICAPGEVKLLGPDPSCDAKVHNE